jgi:hypothetical protein
MEGHKAAPLDLILRTVASESQDDRAAADTLPDSAALLFIRPPSDQASKQASTQVTGSNHRLRL